MNGRLIDVVTVPDSSIFAFSAASVRRCSACRSPTEVDALFFAELGHEPIANARVVVVAAEMRVAVGRLDLEHAVADFEDRHVERAAAEIPHEDRLAGLLVEAVGERRRGRFVDDAQDFEARNLAGVFRRLALRVVEVRGDRDDRFGDALAEIRRRVVDQLLQNHRADLLRRVVLAVDLDLMVGPHLPLDRADRAVRVGDGLALRQLADESFAGLGERHDRRSRSRSFGVGDDGGALPLHHGDDGVGRAEVDPDHFSHEKYVSLSEPRGPAVVGSLARIRSGLAAYRRSRGCEPGRRPGRRHRLSYVDRTVEFQSIRCDSFSVTMVAPRGGRDARRAPVSSALQPWFGNGRVMVAAAAG